MNVTLLATSITFFQIFQNQLKMNIFPSGIKYFAAGCSLKQFMETACII